VYRGRIRVTSYSVRGGDPEKGIVQFEKEQVIHAGVGEAGALIPPFEYHVLENPDPTPAITIHVYGEELTFCHVFEPEGAGFRPRVPRAVLHGRRTSDVSRAARPFPFA
jgi:hypothetical protein